MKENRHTWVRSIEEQIEKRKKLYKESGREVNGERKQCKLGQNKKRKRMLMRKIERAGDFPLRRGRED